VALNFKHARWGAAALVATASLMVAQAQTPDASAQARCFGLTAADLKAAGFTTTDFSGGSPASFTSGGGNVAIIGSPGDDTLQANAATTAIICGKGGADQIQGSLGDDQLKGGPGNDTIRTVGGGRDRVSCGPGRDRVFKDRKDVVSGDCEEVEVG
jgi:Ca2+-binding RTX toxin-like protein